MTRKKKILFLHPYNRYIGGAEYSLRDLTSALDRTGFEIHVHIPAGGKLSGDLSNLGCRMHYYFRAETFHSNRLSNIISTAYRVNKIIRDFRIDLVHCATFFLSNHTLLAGALSRKPVIIHWRDNHFKREFRTGFALAGSVNYRVIAVSEFVAGLFKNSSVSAQKISVIYNGIDLKRYKFCRQKRKYFRKKYRIPAGAVLIGMFSRLEKEKGQETVFTAFDRLAELDKKYYLLVCHSGRDEIYFREMASRCRYGGRIIFTGEVDDPQAAYSAADAACVASSEEAFGRVAVEAMAAGLPVAASSGGALPEIIEPGRSGFLFTPGDSFSCFRAMENILRPEKYTEYKKCALAAGKKFSIEKHAENISRLYEQMIN